MKNWKGLFIKTEDTEDKPQANKNITDTYSFPIANKDHSSGSNASSEMGIADQGVINEVLEVYAKGIDSINMPGYDFYEFYKAISSIGSANEITYKMAFQMAKSMDGNISPQKLLTDAEFYISKINEVYSQYTRQGQQKLNSIDTQRNEEKNKLMHEIETGNQQINQMRNQLQVLETDVNQKRMTLSTIDSKFNPLESVIRQKLLANDNAKQISIAKLIAIKEGIQKNITS